MLTLTRNTIISYLKTHYPSFDTGGSVTVSAPGDPDGEMPDGGLINYIFRVSNSAQSIIVKQGRAEIRSREDFHLPPDRNRLEYETFKLRSAIVPQYIPKIYYIDVENHIFIMEDVSYLPISGRLFCEGKMLPDFGRQCAEYIAATAFYTSEFYLETDKFRDLTKAFMNTTMRHVMEEWVFLRKSHFLPNPLCADLAEYVDGDEAVVAQCYLLRHKFMTHTEALIHADLHTANIFADETRMKVIDMEYTFAGPCSYDVGYLMNNLISQYCSAVFRPFPSEEKRCAFKEYILKMIADLYRGFVTYVNFYWERDAKKVYRSQNAFKQLLTDEFLPDVLGYAAVPGLCRVLCIPTFSEIEMIQDEAARRNALRLCLILDRHLLLHREKFHSIEEVLRVIVQTESIYLHESAGG